MHRGRQDRPGTRVTPVPETTGLISSEIDVYISDMKSTDLFLLGRRLMKLAEEGLPGQGVNNSVRFVLLDVAANPGSSISEITARTGFPQSHVSTSVSTLRQFGGVRTEIDPQDRSEEHTSE